MQSAWTDFDASVLDIEGLTDYRPRRMPMWFRERMRECYLMHTPHDISDEDPVASHVTSDGMASEGSWGAASINDEPVFIFECDYLTDPAAFAADTDCGLLRVEASDQFSHLGFTMFFTQFPVRRRKPEPNREGLLSTEIRMIETNLRRASDVEAGAGGR
jgi:hypothetical protein